MILQKGVRLLDSTVELASKIEPIWHRTRLEYAFGGCDDMATATAAPRNLTRKELIEKLNEDLAREYQAIIAYVVYSQVLKGAEYMAISKELETHAKQELQHAIT